MKDFTVIIKKCINLGLFYVFVYLWSNNVEQLSLIVLFIANTQTVKSLCMLHIDVQSVKLQ